jgi:hypothetical protein
MSSRKKGCTIESTHTAAAKGGLNKDPKVCFILMLPFEMKTVLYGIRLFNDVRHKHRSTLYVKLKQGGREQDSTVTKRECAREGWWQREEVASVVKMTI